MAKKQIGILSTSNYVKLLKDVRQLIEDRKQRVLQVVSWELIDMYWMVGQRIETEGLTGRAHYGEGVLQDLSRDLDIDYSTLRRSVLFFNAYKFAPRGEYLTWSHYRELINVRNVKVRQWYENQVSEQKLTRDQLIKMIKNDSYQESLLPVDSKGISQLERPTKPSYVYKAFVQRVVDGDTLLLRMDLGFQVFKEQRVRLSQVDAPEMDTEEGRQAYEYLRNRLAEVDFVMVKTNMIDIYGRFLGDVFYSHKLKNHDNVFLNGTYLNQELVDQGLVRVV